MIYLFKNKVIISTTNKAIVLFIPQALQFARESLAEEH